MMPWEKPPVQEPDRNDTKTQLDPKVIEAEENLLIDCQIILQETIRR